MTYKRLITVIGLFALTLATSIALAQQSQSNLDSRQVTAIENAPPLCRFGVNVNGNVTNYDTAALRMGWYVDYGAATNPALPHGAEYAPIIRLHQVRENGERTDEYTYKPSGQKLMDAIAANPGADWIIGNEPDRPDFALAGQDDMEPHVYASAYHELYHLIKTADPTAQIFAGAIVQPTPVRLLYLDMVLDGYQQQFGASLPADGWATHNFILNEEKNGWGADIPPGIDWQAGEVLGIEDNDSMELFVERLERFRQWLADRGYRGLPVYLSEYGILMPPDFGDPPFEPPRVNAYMNDTFDYVLSATDPALGDPNDGYRLVQRLSWYSTYDTQYNGDLFDPDDNYALTEMGENFAAYTAAISETADIYPARFTTDPPAPFSPAAPVTLTLEATIANSGNHVRPLTTTVRFYDGDPDQGGVQIGAEQTVALSGCGDVATVSVIWPTVAPGAHPVYVVAEPDDAISETDDANNVMVGTALVAQERAFVPLVSRQP